MMIVFWRGADALLASGASLRLHLNLKNAALANFMNHSSFRRSLGQSISANATSSSVATDVLAAQPHTEAVGGAFVQGLQGFHRHCGQAGGEDAVKG